MSRPCSGGIVAVLAAISLATLAAQGDGKRELVVTGCLLSNGYAGFQVDDAKVDSIDGKTVADDVAAAAPKKWILDGGDNLRQRTGQKVQVAGRSDWGLPDATPGTPHLEVASVKTVAASCTMP